MVIWNLVGIRPKSFLILTNLPIISKMVGIKRYSVSEFIPTIFTASRDVQEMESHC
jgi:hypothetical protein